MGFNINYINGVLLGFQFIDCISEDDEPMNSISIFVLCFEFSIAWLI